jgi:hypothetical protein
MPFITRNWRMAGLNANVRTIYRCLDTAGDEAEPHSSRTAAAGERLAARQSRIQWGWCQTAALGGVPERIVSAPGGPSVLKLSHGILPECSGPGTGGK